jgi:dipeptidyl aminopeptidase/acylaminoacyl peptidase
MNFRSSTGYGKAFINAGNKQWGMLMQDDITWGVKEMVKKGIADPKRVAIMGGSYGGYATLAGLAFTPDVYAAGVDIVGPSNLLTLLNSIPAYWEGAQDIYRTYGRP